jgi:hypothetical protein
MRRPERLGRRNPQRAATTPEASSPLVVALFGLTFVTGVTTP